MVEEIKDEIRLDRKAKRGQTNNNNNKRKKLLVLLVISLGVMTGLDFTVSVCLSVSGVSAAVVTHCTWQTGPSLRLKIIKTMSTSLYVCAGRSTVFILNSGKTKEDRQTDRQTDRQIDR